MAPHPAWHLPLGYKDGVFGAERVPSGAYLGDRDMFLFLVDGNRDLDDPTDALARLACSAGSFSGTAMSEPPPSPWMCSCSASCAAITSSGASSTSPASGAGTWGVDSGRVDDARLTSVRAALDADPRARSRDAPAGHDPGARADARRGARRGDAATRSVAEAGRGGVHAGGSSTRRIPVRSGATCRG